MRFRGAGVLIAWIIIRRCGDITHRRAVLGSSSISVRDLGDIVPLCAERHVRRRKVLLGANGRTGALVVGIIRRCGDNTSRKAMLMVAASAYGISMMRKSRHALSDTSIDVKCGGALTVGGRAACGDNPTLWRYYTPVG